MWKRAIKEFKSDVILLFAYLQVACKITITE